MAPWDLDPPTHPCRDEEDCHILCHDVPDADPCAGFGLAWFEGDNFLNLTAFYDPTFTGYNYHAEPLVMKIEIYDEGQN